MSTHSVMVSAVPAPASSCHDLSGPPGRAAPLPRADRQAAIVAATLPLLRVHGHSVTSRQIAEAAGVGEGTVFRAFRDKAELIDACLASAFDQAPTKAQFAAIDRDLPLRSRLEAAVDVLQRRLTTVVELLIALSFPQPPGAAGRRSIDPQLKAGHDQVLAALTELLEPDAEKLRVPPAEAAKVIRMLVFAMTHPKITDDQPMPAGQIVDLVLHGIAEPPVRESMWSNR